MTNKVARLALEKLPKGPEGSGDTMVKQPLRKPKKEPHYLMERNTQPRESYLNKVIELMDLDEKELFNKIRPALVLRYLASIFPFKSVLICNSSDR